MTTFEEDFKKEYPSLKKFATGKDSITIYDVQKHCLDKKKVLEAIDEVMCGASCTCNGGDCECCQDIIMLNGIKKKLGLI